MLNDRSPQCIIGYNRDKISDKADLLSCVEPGLELHAAPLVVVRVILEVGLTPDGDVVEALHGGLALSAYPGHRGVTTLYLNHPHTENKNKKSRA